MQVNNCYKNTKIRSAQKIRNENTHTHTYMCKKFFILELRDAAS